jgi:hypothetical protein
MSGRHVLVDPPFDFGGDDCRVVSQLETPERDQRRPYGHYQENEGRGYENGETQHNNIDHRLNETETNPQGDIEPS